MKTFQTKIKSPNVEDLNFLWNASDEFCRYYNSMLNTLRIDFEIKSRWPKELRTFLSKYELQKLYSAKALKHKPEFLLSWQIQGTSDQLYNSIKSFYQNKSFNPKSRFPYKEKKYDEFHPLYFSFSKNSSNIKILNDNQIELSFQNKKKIVLDCIYNKKHKLSKLNLSNEGHKIVLKNDQFYFHFCTNSTKIDLPTTSKSIFIDLGQKTLVTGFCPETKEIITISGSHLRNKKLTKRKEEVQSKIDTKKRNSRKHKKLKRTFKRLQRKETNQKRTFLHKVSKKLIDEFDLIVIGNLKGIKENTKSLFKGINKQKFTFWPVALFVNFLDYKSANRCNKVFLKIDESYTTMTCSCCGHRKQMSLKDRMYICPNCGLRIARDLNSALNIYDRYLQPVPGLYDSNFRRERLELVGALRTKVLRVM